MKELLIGVGTFTSRPLHGLKFVTINKLKFVSAIFIIFYFFTK